MTILATRPLTKEFSEPLADVKRAILLHALVSAEFKQPLHPEYQYYGSCTYPSFVALSLLTPEDHGGLSNEQTLDIRAKRPVDSLFAVTAPLEGYNIQVGY
jgi:hypothetical protein